MNNPFPIEKFLQPGKSLFQTKKTRSRKSHPANANDLHSFPENGGVIELAGKQEVLKLIGFGNWDNTPEPHYYFDYEPCFLPRQKK